MTLLRVQRQNANRHTARGLQALKTSIDQDGWIGALTIAADGETFDGSARIETAGDDMHDAILVESDGTRPVIVKRTDIPTADDPKAVRLGLAANRVASLNLEWEPDVLAAIADHDIDLSNLWTPEEWQVDALPAIILPEAGAGGDAFDSTPDESVPIRCQTGDLWMIGRVHRLLIGDSTKGDHVTRLLNGETPLLMVTDPPYGVNYTPEWRSTNRIGKVENDDRADWREAYAFAHASIVYCWHASRHASSVQDGLEAAGFELRAQIIWAKTRLVFSQGHYHWQHEPCWYGVRHGATAQWAGDCTQTTLWTMGIDPDIAGGHSTQKPLECMARPIRNHGAVGDLVYDPFLGSGTTLIAAHREGRRCYGMEIAPRYGDVILQRAEAEGLIVERVDHA